MGLLQSDIGNKDTQWNRCNLCAIPFPSIRQIFGRRKASCVNAETLFPEMREKGSKFKRNVFSSGVASLLGRTREIRQQPNRGRNCKRGKRATWRYRRMLAAGEGDA